MTVIVSIKVDPLLFFIIIFFLLSIFTHIPLSNYLVLSLLFVVVFLKNKSEKGILKSHLEELYSQSNSKLLSISNKPIRTQIK